MFAYLFTNYTNCTNKFDLQDSLATKAFMSYNNHRAFQEHDIFEKSRQQKAVSFNGIKLIA